VLRRPVGPEYEPVWPEKWSAERLRRRKDEIGSASFARGYHLRAVAEEDTLIRPGWVRYWHEPAGCDTVILSVELVWYRRGVARLRGAASVDGRLAVSANFTTVVRGRAA
jgi:hypothetical protein